MPELPEVETVRRGLMPVMEGQVILRADINRPDLRFAPAGGHEGAAGGGGGVGAAAAVEVYSG